MSDKIVEAWRPFVASAPDFELELRAGEKIRIPMSDYMHQGAVDLDDFHSPLNAEKDPLFANSPLTKRGWLYNLAVLNQPKYGTVSYDEQRRGFVYQSKSSYVGEDCFNYILSNGKQISTTGKITLNVLENYKLILEVEQNSSGQYRIIAHVESPEGVPPVEKIYYRWYSIGPYLKDERVHIGRSTFLVDERWPVFTRIYRIPGEDGGYYVGSKGDRAGFLTPRHETDFEGIKDSRTGEPFEPIDRFNDVEITADLRFSGQEWNEPYDIQLVARLSDFYGMPWEDNGAIRDPDVPDSDELAGIIKPPYIINSPQSVYVQVPDVL